MVKISVLELFKIVSPSRDFRTLEISSISDHASTSLGILSALLWFYISISLTAISCVLFICRSNPRRPPSPAPPMVPLFSRIYNSASTDPFPPDSSVPRTPSPANHGSTSCLPMRLSTSPGFSTLV